MEGESQMSEEQGEVESEDRGRRCADSIRVVH